MLHDPWNAAPPRRPEEPPGAVDVDPPDVSGSDEREVVGAVDEHVDAGEHAVPLAPPAARTAVRRSLGRVADEPDHLVATSGERTGQERTDVAVGAGDGDAAHRSQLRCPAAIRWAFAMMESVNVVAGTFGKTAASTRWVRCQLPTRPRRSDERKVACPVIGKLEPQW